MTTPWWFRWLDRAWGVAGVVRQWAITLRRIDPAMVMAAMAPQFVWAGA